MPRAPKNSTLYTPDDQPSIPGAPPPPTSPTPGTPPASGPVPPSQVPPSSYNPGLVASFDKTNLDTENARPNGGIPYSQAGDPTVYPKTTNHQSPTRGYFASPGKAPLKFEQKYSAKNTYLDSMQKYI